MTHSDLRLEQR